MNTMPRYQQIDWKKWMELHPNEVGWGATEFDMLMRYGATTSLIQRLWRVNYRTAEKRVNSWKKEHI